MRRSPLTWSLLAVGLLIASALGGYGISAVLDDDDGPSTRAGTDDGPSAPDDVASAGTDPPDGQTVVASALGIVGWWDGDAWVDGAGEPPVVDGLGFTFLPLEGAGGTARGGPLGTACEIEPQPSVELSPTFSATNVLAVSGVDRPLPRRVETLDRASATYRTAATEALATVGITDAAPTLTQLVRIDLDGDGSDEVLLTAERRSSAELIEAKAGDYSAVIVRRLAGGGVQSQVLSFHEATEDGPGELVFMQQFRIASVADLNGDGALEVALSSEYYEGSGLEVFAGSSGNLRSVLTIGCGA